MESKTGRIVRVTFNNRKRQGRYFRQEEAEVAIFASGRCVFDTEALPQRGFSSLKEAVSFLDTWGDHTLMQEEEEANLDRSGID